MLLFSSIWWILYEFLKQEHWPTNGCIQFAVKLRSAGGQPVWLTTQVVQPPPTFWLHWRIPSCHLPDWPSAEAAKPKVRHLLRKGLPLVWSHSICFANSFTAAACRLWGLVWRGRLQRCTPALAWPQAGLCAAKRPQLSESLSILWGRGRARDCPSVRPCCPPAPAHCPSCPHRLHSHVTPVSFFHAAPPLAASPLITSLCDCGSLHFALPLFFFFFRWFDRVAPAGFVCLSCFHLNWPNGLFSKVRSAAKEEVREVGLTNMNKKREFLRFSLSSSTIAKL